MRWQMRQYHDCGHHDLQKYRNLGGEDGIARRSRNRLSSRRHASAHYVEEEEIGEDAMSELNMDLRDSARRHECGIAEGKTLTGLRRPRCIRGQRAHRDYDETED